MSEHLESQIHHIKAQIAGNSGPIAKICNADAMDLGSQSVTHRINRSALKFLNDWTLMDTGAVNTDSNVRYIR